MSETQPKLTEQYGKFPLWFLRLFILITAAAGLNAGFEIYRAHNSSDWSSVTGMIERSWGSIGPDLPNIKYTYKVAGKTYQGNTVAFRDVVGIYEKKRVLNLYPSGKKVDVYFNPDNHGESVLEPGYKKGSGIWILVPWGMCIIGIFLHRHVSTIRRKTLGRGYS